MMTEAHQNTVRRKLRGYAQRGVFKGLTERSGRSGQTVFEFTWIEASKFTLVMDKNRGVLVFKDLLPNVPARSLLDRELRGFLKARANGQLPAHRRVDPKRAEIRAVNRQGKISIEVDVKRNQYAYGVGKLLRLAQEIFGYLHMNAPQYLWDNFDVPAE